MMNAVENAKRTHRKAPAAVSRWPISPENAGSMVDYAKRTHGRTALTLFVVMFIAAVLAKSAAGEDAPATASKPGPVTIHLDAKHPNDVLAEITAKTGLTFNVWPENLWE